MTEGNFMTEKSRQRIMAEIRSLEATRPEITDRIGAARLQGGLEENEELLMALEDMQRLEQSLGRQTDNLVDAQIIQPISLGKKKNVAVGQRMLLINAVNCPTRIENLVSTMLRIRLSKHH